MKKILLIIPSYNEEKNVNNLWKNICDYNKKNKQKYDCIFINDGSKDSTGKVLDENNIPHIDLVMNLGIGGAVQTGYKYALLNYYDVAVQFDGDGQHNIDFVKDIIDPILNNECDLCIGSRFILNTKKGFKSSMSRRMGIKIISICINVITRTKIYDTTSGFRAVNEKLIKKFAIEYPTEYPEPVSEVEVLKQGYKIKEVPVIMNERKAGKSSIHAWKKLYYMVNVILSIFITSVRRYKKYVK